MSHENINAIETSFSEIKNLIDNSRRETLQVVNSALVELYWNIGEFISEKIGHMKWGKSVVENLALYLSKNVAGGKGFSAQNLWRMKQFYETYHKNSILSPLVREINWTNNMVILSRSKTEEEAEFYLKLCIKE